MSNGPEQNVEQSWSDARHELHEEAIATYSAGALAKERLDPLTALLLPLSYVNPLRLKDPFNRAAM